MRDLDQDLAGPRPSSSSSSTLSGSDAAYGGGSSMRYRTAARVCIPAPPVLRRQVAAASFIGTTIEWYDFFLYGTAAALVFNRLFFPEFSPLAGTLPAFSTYAVGFVARPVGGIVIGHYGDKIGRKSMLILSLLIMGVATFLIGLLPTYAAIGVAAPILLVVLRLAQGFGVGGEWGGAVVLAVEHAPPGRRGFYGAWPQMGVPAGLLLSTGVFTLFNTLLSDAAFLSWGWRVPFLLSVVLVAVGLFIRLRIVETPAFQRVKDTGSEARMPIVEAIRTHPRNVLLAMGMRIAENGVFYVFTVFSLTYGAQVLKVPAPRCWSACCSPPRSGCSPCPTSAGCRTGWAGDRCTSAARRSRRCTPSPSSGSWTPGWRPSSGWRSSSAWSSTR
jgi:MFS family permease